MLPNGSGPPAGTTRPRTVVLVTDINPSPSSKPDDQHPAETIAQGQDLTNSRRRSLNFDGMVNARDLGGLVLADGSGVIDCGRLVRSASPQLLSERGAQQLYSYGVRTVVDLRTRGEQEREGYGPLGRYYDDGTITHLDAPLLSESSWAHDPVGTAAGLDDPARHYISYLADTDTLNLIATSVSETAARGEATLLHCAFGKDRTGVVSALLLDTAGACHDAIIDDYQATTAHLDQLIERFRGARSYFRDLTNPDPVAMAPQAVGIAGMLRWLGTEHGGSAAFLARAGVRADTLLALRRHLRYQAVLSG